MEFGQGDTAGWNVLMNILSNPIYQSSSSYVNNIIIIVKSFIKGQ
jgi:hypothetical protein